MKKSIKDQSIQIELKRINESIRMLHRKINLVEDKLKRHTGEGK